VKKVKLALLGSLEAQEGDLLGEEEAYEEVVEGNLYQDHILELPLEVEVLALARLEVVRELPLVQV
jgi:hypothetical protein